MVKEGSSSIPILLQTSLFEKLLASVVVWCASLSYHNSRKMNSKAFIFLGLVFALLLLITSAVAAEEAAAASKDDKNVDEEAKETNQYGGRGHRCPYGCCGSYGRYGCSSCCKSPAEAANYQEANKVADTNGYGGGGYGGGRGGGGYGGGHGGGGYGGGHGGGGGWGGGHGRGGGGRRCCSSAEEARNYYKQNIEANP